MSHRKVTDDKINKALDAQVDSDDNDELDTAQAATNQQEQQTKATTIKKEVQSCLDRGQLEDAIKAACKDSSKFVIESLIPLFNDIIGSGKCNTDKFVNSLNTNELDACMKFVYKSMESLSKGTAPNVNIQSILQFHEKVCLVGGVGSIVRVITDTQ